MYHAEKCELTHIIRTRIDVEDNVDALKVQKCKICQNNATIYCQNDVEYFC